MIFLHGDRVLVTTVLGEMLAVVERVDDPAQPGFYAVRPTLPHLASDRLLVTGDAHRFPNDMAADEPHVVHGR